MKKILASNFLNYHKIDGVKIPNKWDNTNKILDCILNNLNGNDGILFVASDPKSYERIKEYSDIFFESLRLSGISFNNYYILTDKTKDNVEEYVNNSNMIFISGGDTPTEMDFLNSINFSKYLVSYDGLVLGQSAGALNMANDVYNSPEFVGDLAQTHFKGLGLVDFNIEPHFVFDDNNFDEDEKYQRESILQESKTSDIIGVCNGSHILVDDNSITIYGESYFISNGKILPIIENGCTKLIDNLNNIHNEELDGSSTFSKRSK